VVKKTKDEDGTEKIIVRKKENDNERWVECSERISSKRKEVPWYLVICYKYILPRFIILIVLTFPDTFMLLCI
jgi:hypothetical protein